MFLAKIYLVLLVLVALSAVLYIGVDILLYRETFRIQERWICAAAAVISAVILCLPLHIHYDPVTYALYTYGPAAMATYVGVLSMILLNLYLIVHYRRQLRSRRLSAMVVWMAAWLTAAVIQFLNSDLLVVGYACCLGVAIIFFQSENPEINLDRSTGMFNQTAFHEYLQQIFYTRASYSMFVFICDQQPGQTGAEEFFHTLSQTLLARKDALVFKTADDEIVMLRRQEESKPLTISFMQKFAAENYTRNGTARDSVKALFLENCLLAKTPEELFSLIRYCRRQALSHATQRLIPIDAPTIQEMYAEADLARKVDAAILADRIEVYLQPIYSVAQKRFVSAEALVRLFDENGRMLPVFPAICAAEESGQIHRLGERVFEKVCQLICEKTLEKYGLLYIEVNLSVAQCCNDSLADRYIQIMQYYSIDPNTINLEITESAAVKEKQTLLRNMEKLIACGVKFSLDDFGTGQSNLNYIVEMPVHIVKFDRDMTKAYFESPRGRFVMNAAISMIHEMHLRIVSEGIETKEQFAEMERRGIDYIQGYYFSKPLPTEEFFAFIQKHLPTAACKDASLPLPPKPPLPKPGSAPQP